MGQSTRTGTIQGNEQAQFALIGIAVTLLGVQVVYLLTGATDPWQWLMLGAPVAILIAAISNLRRIRRRG